MMFLVVLVASAVLVYVLKPAVKKAPIAWYLLALALVFLYLAGARGVLPSELKDAAFALLQKGTLAVALLVIVMFIGALPRESRARKRLAQIRAELSIIASILVVGHVVVYGMSFIPRVFGSGQISLLVCVGLAVAVVASALLLVLAITSVNVIKLRMKKQTWKKVQKLAYAFTGLAYVHILFMLLPSAVAGAGTALQSVVVYTIVYGAYAVMRIYRAISDRKEAGRIGDACEISA